MAEHRQSGLAATVAKGDRRKSLEAVRDELACLLEGADRRTAPALAARLQSVLAELDRLPGGREVTKLDQLADGVTIDLAVERKRRTGRQPGAANS